MILDASLLNTQHYKVRIKGKVEQSRERSSTLPYSSSYRKRSPRVTLDYGRQLYFTYMYQENLALNNLRRLVYHKTEPKSSNHHHEWRAIVEYC